MQKRKIVQYSLAGKIIQIHESAKEAAKSVGLNSHAGIINCCQEKPNCIQTKGFMWKYHPSDSAAPVLIEPARSRGQVFKEMYGLNSEKHPEILEKRKKTSLLRYGTDHHMKNKEFKQKFDSIIREKWGVDNIANHQEVKTKISNTERSRKSSALIEKFQNFHFVCLDENNIFTFLSDECGHQFQINRQLLTLRSKNKNTICTICNKPDSNTSSEIEKFLGDELVKMGIKIDRNVKGLVKSRHEVDLYLSEYKIGIEVDGIKFHTDHYGKGEKYHINKTKIFGEAGISLLHFFDDEIYNKTELVINTILNKIGKSQRIFARKCVVGSVDPHTSKQFLENNHLQGAVGSHSNLGLFFNDELVSIMTFGHKRKSLGSSYKEGEWELLRFCNLSGFSVVGGASKLFKSFVEDQNPDEIISYANLRWSTGNLYDRLGFNFAYETPPSYWYFYKNKRVHRYSLRKQVLVSMGMDSSKSESELTEMLGIPKIYDCGNLKFVWNKKTNVS
jgi:very-short-patch-repair endonuclease